VSSCNRPIKEKTRSNSQQILFKKDSAFLCAHFALLCVESSYNFTQSCT